MSETILFFGSGPVAASALELLARDFNVKAVITKPRPAHHKDEFPVVQVAEKLGLKILTPANKAELSELFEQEPVRSRLGVVIDYGIIIDQDVIDYFPLGIINSHFSLLPRWRGADPISFAILKGDRQTGVSLMRIVAALDEGPLLSQRSLAVSPDDTTPTLTEKLIALSHELTRETLPAYVAGEIKPAPQSGEATYSRKLTKADSELDFHKSAPELEREIRAFTGWPRSRTRVYGVDVIITKAHVSEDHGTPGNLWQDKNQFGIYCRTGLLLIDHLIPAGKKEMSVTAFLAGYRPSHS